MLIRDILCFLGGWGMIIHDVAFLSGQEPRWLVLLMGGALVGVPGVAEILGSLRGTGGQPSPAPSEASVSSSSTGSPPT